MGGRVASLHSRNPTARPTWTTTSIDIVSFHERLVAHGWPRDFGSGKSPAMSYATVQGPEALVEKFRNSSVMLETFDYHPVGLVRQVTEFLGHAMATALIIASSSDSPQFVSPEE
ncbi:hypothetical protein HDK77DRAFT_143793 [Phyllosticta capitalensis]